MDEAGKWSRVASSKSGNLRGALLLNSNAVQVILTDHGESELEKMGHATMQHSLD